ncbi:MAG TPA: tryptophan 2,3-dioxygenase family protein [Alphaproteobacteria bacterium]|nr:tryptophan 2,3-dioxygenase family protein [Alphaproteobacteria bacterium]
MNDPSSRPPVYYGDYLQVDRLLSCQERESTKLGRPAHDEMLFIIIHQAYELWFKQILFELDAVQDVFARDRVNDRDVGRAGRALDRVHAILKLLVHQVDVLETMTPLDFLDFRDLLYPASGFQSAQFRQIETRLGLRRGDRLAFDRQSFDQRLSAKDRDTVKAVEGHPSLFDQVEAWLERTPFVEFGGYRFQEAYRGAVGDMLQRDIDYLRDNPTLGEAERDAEIKRLESARERFEALFDEARHRALHAKGLWRFSLRALQAALFINLYRDEPALQVPFNLLSRLMDIDETMTTWRHRHALMVQRMIGLKIGTGGSSGHDYLRATTDSHRVFGDLFALSTFLISRSTLPGLPEPVRQAMGFTYAAEQEQEQNR